MMSFGLISKLILNFFLSFFFLHLSCLQVRNTEFPANAFSFSATDTFLRLSDQSFSPFEVSIRWNCDIFTCMPSVAPSASPVTSLTISPIREILRSATAKVLPQHSSHRHLLIWRLMSCPRLLVKPDGAVWPFLRMVLSRAFFPPNRKLFRRK